MFRLLCAAGAVVTAAGLPQTRAVVKDVPWMALAVVVGCGLLCDGIDNRIRWMGSDGPEEYEETYTVEVLQDPTVRPSPFWGHVGEQVLRRNLRGFTVVKRTVATPQT